MCHSALPTDGRYMQRKLNLLGSRKQRRHQYTILEGSNSEAADTYNSSMNYQDSSYIQGT